MTQHIKPAVSQAVVTAPVSTSQSPVAADLAALHKRISNSVSIGKGTTRYGAIVSVSGQVNNIVMENSVYSALVTAGVDFSDAIYNQSTPSGTEGNTSALPIVPNQGLHRQVVLSFGDSLSDGKAGQNTIKGLAYWINSVGLMGISGEQIFLQPEGDPIYAPDRVYSMNPHTINSRIIFDFSAGGWRCTNISGYTYVSGSPWLDNLGRASQVVLATGQEMAIIIWLGTNDIDYANASPNTGLSAVPSGTVGYTYAGSPNYIQNSLTPLITALKTLYPTAKIIVQSSIARDASGTSNAKFFEIETYMVANKAFLNIDLIIKSSSIPELDPRTPSVTNNLTFYQNDKTHLTEEGYRLIRPYREAAFDYLLGIELPTEIESAFV
jgi:lysophospholipase L1-like esterase